MQGAAALLFAFAGAQASAATITIINGDGAGEGLNDPTPKVPEGGNMGVTLGAQRLIALQAAANVWGAMLQSNIDIKVNAKFDGGFTCDATSGTVGSAGASNNVTLAVAPPGGFTGTFYPIALAEALSNSNLNGATAEINAIFNSDVDGPVCFGTKSFYYGINAGNAPANSLALFPVVLHELGHGLGFASLACVQAGGCSGGSIPFGGYPSNVPDIWGRFLAEAPANTLWKDMTNAARSVSMTGDPNLVWMGTNVTATAGGLAAGTNNGRVRMHAPAAIVQGSSVSHFSSDVLPNEVMEPVIVLSAVVLDPGRAAPLMKDIGWTLLSGGGNTPLVFANGFE